jgi:hypothetical protein
MPVNYTIATVNSKVQVQPAAITIADSIIPGLTGSQHRPGAATTQPAGLCCFTRDDRQWRPHSQIGLIGCAPVTLTFLSGTPPEAINNSGPTPGALTGTNPSSFEVRQLAHSRIAALTSLPLKLGTTLRLAVHSQLYNCTGQQQALVPA